MTLREEQERVQKAVNNSLAHVREDPWLTQRVLANAKGEEPVKRKMSLTLVLCILLGIAAVGTGYALASSQVAAFFAQHWNKDLGTWLESGKVAQIGETVELSGVMFTLDEVVYKDRGIYGVGTARMKDEKDVLIPMDIVDAWDLEEVAQGEETQALIQQARNAGGRLLSIDCWPGKIGVDGGSMVNVGDAGAYNIRNEDGSITFSFETGGYALEDGTVYRLELSIDVDEWTAEGMVKNDSLKPQAWTVEFEPVMIMETPAVENEKEIPAADMQLTGFELVVPETYQKTGTLPLYRAVEYDFTKTVKPEWFNQSGIAEMESATYMTFNDHAVLGLSSETVWYAENTGELFDYNWRERETHNPNIEPSLLPRHALSMGIADMASGVYHGFDYAQGIELEHEQLTKISLEDAKKTAEALFDKLGLQGFELAWALDMSVDRIHTLGEAYNHFWFEGGGGYSNSPRQDYAAATAEDEGYYLIYTPLGVTKVTDGRQQLNLFVTSRGIVFADLRCMYNRGGEAGTPGKLISPEEAIASLYQEAARSRDRIEIASIERVALTYVPIRAENKQDGMVFAPVWQVLFTEAGTEYESWAEFSAVDDSIINAIFQ